MGGKKKTEKKTHFPQEREYESDTPRFKRGTTHLKMAGHASTGILSKTR